MHIDEDGAETFSRPGGQALIEGGATHGDACLGVVSCILLLDFDGQRDVILPE